MPSMSFPVDLRIPLSERGTGLPIIADCNQSHLNLNKSSLNLPWRTTYEKRPETLGRPERVRLLSTAAQKCDHHSNKDTLNEIMSIPMLEALFKEQDRNFERRAMLNWETGASKERLSSQVVMVEYAGFEHVDNILPALHPDAKTTEDIFDDNYSEEQLTCGRNKVENLFSVSCMPVWPESVCFISLDFTASCPRGHS